MAELATIARPYAEALFKATTSLSGVDLGQTADWVDELAAFAADSQLKQFSESPKVSNEQVFNVLSGMTKYVLPDQGKNFLRALIDNGRLQALPEIATQFRKLVNARSGSSDAIVFSAFPVDGAALADLAASLEKRFGRKLNLTVQLDATLIGGVRVAVGDEVLDTSVKARLEQMKAALAA